MELWIRSQDKRELLKVNDGLYIANGFTDTDDTFIGIKNVGHIGRYTTEKRALEVLDEIQDKIVINAGYELATNSGIRPDNIKPANYTSVYEMPKE